MFFNNFCLAFSPTLRTIVFVRYLGLERLSNAFGLTCLFMSFAAIFGSPLSVFIKEQTGDYKYGFLFSSICFFVSGMFMILAEYVHSRRKNEKNVQR